MNKRTTYRCATVLMIVGVLAAGQAIPASAASAPARNRQQAEEDGGWPRQIDHPRATIIMYQPEIETFSGNTLSGRAVVSVTRTGETTPVFGAVWMDSRIATDRESRMIEILDVSITNVRFPNATPEDEQGLAGLLEEEIPGWNLMISMDRVIAGLDLAERKRESANLRMDPPTIMFVDYPAVLISIDGAPLTQPADSDSRLLRVVNTAFTIIEDTGTSTHYLYAGADVWYASSDVASGWRVTTSVPTAVEALKPEDPDEEAFAGDEADAEDPPAVPRIIIATEPTELIVTDGAPEYSPITGTDLLYITNTDSDVLMEVATQRHFVVLSGRWYAGAGLEGPWKHVAPDELPGDFSRIPPESEMGSLLINVPNTQLASDRWRSRSGPRPRARLLREPSNYPN